MLSTSPTHREKDQTARALSEARDEGAEASRRLLAANEALAAAKALAGERERELAAQRRSADAQAARVEEAAREAAAQVRGRRPSMVPRGPLALRLVTHSILV